MAYKIQYKRSVSRDLRKLDKAVAGRLLDQLEKDLAENPETHPLLKGAFAGLRKYRAGDYRVIYAVLDQEVVVLRNGHRRDVYR